MKELCAYRTPYKCKNCGQDMLFFETRYNTLIDYKGLFRNGNTLHDIKDYLEEKNIRFMKCLVCGKSYIIDWTSKFPTPLLEKENLKKFGV